MKKLLLLLILCASITTLTAQEKTISGILEDEGDVLIGANVIVSRNGVTQHATITDIDGKYTITCQVGDKIEFSYIGFVTQSIIVTHSMLHSYKNFNQQKISKIESKAFKNKMDERRAKLLSSINKNSNEGIQVAQLLTHYGLNYEFVDFEFVKGKIKLIKTEQPIKFDLSIIQKIGIQSVQSYHSYQLQNEFSQGRPIDGKLTFQDFSEGESHSFGPMIGGSTIPNINSYDNNIFKSGITIGTKINFKAEQNNKKIFGALNYERSPDIFNSYTNNFTELRIGFIDFKNNWTNENKWNVEFNVNRLSIGNHNYTGYYQNVLKFMMVQSPSFDTQSGIEENSSFNTEFDHPKWLLNNNSNPVTSNEISLFVNNNLEFLDEENKLSNSLLIGYKTMNIFENYNNNNELHSNHLKVTTPSAKLITNLELNVCESSLLKLKIDNLATATTANFLSKKNQIEVYNQTEHLIRNTSTTKLEYDNNDIKIALGVNSLFSNNQTNDLLSPNLFLSHKFYIYRKKVDVLQPYISAERLVKNLDLLLDRYNYSALQIEHNRSQDLSLDIPLWLPNNLSNEYKKEYKIGIKASKKYSKSDLSSRLEYKYVDHQNVIFPILENNQWILQNVADFSMNNISWFSEWRGWKEIFNERVNFSNSFEISHFTTKVNKLNVPSDKVPIAGYESVSKNLIAGQSVGVIVGSDFKRNTQGDRLIANDGFPIKSNKLHIIADPTPLFTFAYAQEISIDQLSLKVIVDGQVGGKIWNGTQQTLDYYGVSQNTAEDRFINNYIFEGVDSEGNINDTQVSFADPQLGLENNRWVRYGADGVASEYIRNASHIRLKSIELSYMSNKYENNITKVSFYAKNLFTIASFRGFTNSHLYEDSISQGLQYFNQPITTEVGMSLTYKL